MSCLIFSSHTKSWHDSWANKLNLPCRVTTIRCWVEGCVPTHKQKVGNWKTNAFLNFRHLTFGLWFEVWMNFLFAWCTGGCELDWIGRCLFLESIIPNPSACDSFTNLGMYSFRSLTRSKKNNQSDIISFGCRHEVYHKNDISGSYSIFLRFHCIWNLS